MSKCVYSDEYISLFDDGTIGMSDGVGYVGQMRAEDVREFYEALKNFYESKG